MEKICRTCEQKLVSDHYLILVNSYKDAKFIQEKLLEGRYLERGLPIIIKKSDFIFVCEPSLFLCTLL